MADAVTSVGAIRAGDTITYTDHFGGDSEGPVSTAILSARIRYKGSTFSLSKSPSTHSVPCAECVPRDLLSENVARLYLMRDTSAARSASSRAIAEVKVNGRARDERDGGRCGLDG